MKRKHKTLVNIALVLALCLLLNTGIPVRAEDSTQIADRNNQNEYGAILAYQEIGKLFNYSEEGTVYPTEYSGAWIENGVLVIALTDLLKIPFYENLVTEPNCIRFVNHNYSLNELSVLQEYLFSLLNADNSKHCVTGYYIDEINNRLVFEVTTNPEEFFAYFIAEIVPEIDLKDICMLNHLNKDDILSLLDFREGELAVFQSTLYGGSFTCSDEDGGTVGVCGTIYTGNATYSGFVTAGHLMPTLSSSDFYDSTYTTIIGNSVIKHFYNNGYGDWVLVKKTNQATLTNKVYGPSGSLVSITDTVSNLPVNSSCYKYGYVSGGAQAVVVAVQVTQGFDQDNDGDVDYTIKGLTKCSVYSGTSTGGDSGGPYFISNYPNSGYGFAGIHTGAVTMSNGTKYWYFTPYARFESYFVPYQTMP